MDERNTKKSEIAESVMIPQSSTSSRNCIPMHETPLSENVNSFWRRPACVGGAILVFAAAVTCFLSKKKFTS